jgi:hypothetical protein
MKWRFGPFRGHIVVVTALALVGLVAAGFARAQILDLDTEDDDRSVRRFGARAREVEVDARQPWARIPWILPGPGDDWAGGIPHVVTLRLGQRPRRPLMLFVDVAGGLPPSWKVTAHARADVRAALVAPAGLTVSVQGRALPTEVRRSHRGTLRRYRVRVLPEAFGAEPDARLSLLNESAGALVLEHVRIEERVPTFSWAHLGRRGALPRESAVFVAASLAWLLLWNVGSTRRAAWSGRLLAASGPAAGLMLVGLAVAGRAPSWVLGAPVWSWALLPLLLLGLRPRRRAPPLRRRVTTALINGALALTALAVSVGAAELAVRFAYRSVKSASDARVYFQKDNRTYNSLGFDEREFSPDKPAHTYRIAFLGDSLSVNVSRSERYATVIVRLLNESGPPGLTYEGVSFATAGTDTGEQLDTLRRSVWRSQPDFVVLQWYVNDFELGARWGRPYPSPLIPWENVAGVFIRKSALYALLQGQWEKFQERLGLVKTYPEYMYERFGDPEGRDSLAAVATIKEFIEECRSHATPVSIVLIPHVDETLAQGQSRYDFLHERVLQACRDEKVTCVDLRATFGAYADYRRLWASPLDAHLNPFAHGLAAERVVAELGEVWRAGPTRPRAATPSPQSIAPRSGG